MPISEKWDYNNKPEISSFTVLKFRANEFDILSLDKEKHYRAVYESKIPGRDAGWSRDKKLWSTGLKINVKDLIPKSEFFEYFLSEAHGCSIGVNKHDSQTFSRGRKLC